MRTRLTSALRCSLLLAPFAALSLAFGQTIAPAPATLAAKKPAELVTLNPFEVKAEADNSYGALNSNSLTQFNTALNKTPVSADIFTAEFMRDIGATSIEEMLNGYGAGAGTVMSNPDSDALSQQPGDRVGNQTIGIRGTAIYIEVEAARAYVCLCYGEIDITSTADPAIRETLRTTHHDQPRYVMGPGAGEILQRAPVINHTDAELIMLESLVGRRVPFLNSPMGY